MITITTVGYGDIVPVTPRARMLDTIAVTPIRLFVWLLSLGSAYAFIFHRALNRWRLILIPDRLHDPVVVSGLRASGGQAVPELLRRGSLPDVPVVPHREEARRV